MGPPDRAGQDDVVLAEDPDSLDAGVMTLVAEAAAMLREQAKPPAAAVDQVISRVRMEAFVGQVFGTAFGAIGRTGRAAPDLLGLADPPATEPDDPTTSEDDR